MAISKINTVFAKHSRVLFGVITVVIIITFVGFLSPSGLTALFPGGDSEQVGSIFGKKVTYKDVAKEVRLMQIFYLIQMGQLPSADRLSEQAFEIMCWTAAAEARGIRISDQEIADFIIALPQFQKDGKFDQTLFNTFLQEKGVTGEDCDNAIRLMLTLQRVQDEIFNNVIITPNEVELFALQRNAELHPLVAYFNTVDFEKQVNPTDEQLQQYFTECQEGPQPRYIQPAKFKAEIAEISYKTPAILSAAAKSATPEAVKKYYDTNPQQFTNSETGTAEPFDGKGEQMARAAYIAAKAKELALQQARNFADVAFEMVSDAQKDQVEVFRKQAAEYHWPVIATDFFAADAQSIGELAEPKLIEAIARADEAVPVSEPVAGESAVYVGFVSAVQPAQAADFEAVGDQVRHDYLASEADKLAQAAAEEAAKTLQAMTPEELRQAVTDGKPVKFEEKPVISSATQPTTFEAMLTAYTASRLQVGRVSAPETSGNGYMLIYLAERTVPESIAPDQLSFLEALYRQNRQQAAAVEFQNFVGANCFQYKQKGN
ncbi:peptidylprolyl isomerase [Victivallis sp. Marseille-Q1083]|uniref:peptidylprolyl isomerase n=1 Tax=Victivallis sp. Marseille-Q1083 TaxID=2717288 RepID=UPI00158D458C|nr:SurA N-terminal domain-containing protein [Victivallis sp. Marseille-Q1083]